MTKATAAKQQAKPKYKTADELGILPEERTALIAFVEAPALGRVISVNGKSHYYAQSYVADESVAQIHECGTAGCVAGFVFAHIRYVQKKRSVRHSADAEDYANAASSIFMGEVDKRGVLEELFEEGQPCRLKDARKVVQHALRTGKVDWSRADTFRDAGGEDEDSA